MSITERIEQLLKQSPGLRTIQIADKLDLPLEPVMNELVEMEAAGTIRSEDIDAPNGRKAKAYSLAADTAVSAAAGVATAQRLTHAQRVIDFIAGQPDQTATSAQLHQLLGLKPTEYASSFLGGAVRDGRLVKDGKTWKLGPAVALAMPIDVQPSAAPLATLLPIPTFLPPTPAAAPAAPARANPMAALVADAEATTAAIAAGKSRPQAPKNTTDQRAAQPATPAAAAPAPVVPAPTGTPAYRCALWSDGILEVRRDGQTVAELEQAAGESLAAFLSRLTADREAA